MRILCAVFLVVLAVAPLSAQYGSVGGFGNVAFRGLGHAPAGNPWGNVVFPAVPGGAAALSSGANAGFPSQLGGIVSGFRPYNGAPEGRGGGRRRGVASIYAYPVYVGGYGYGYGYDQEPQATQQAPNITVIYPPSQQAPVIITGQGGAEQGQPQEAGANSNFHYYPPQSGNAEAAPSDATYYLVAFKDHTIYSAVAYYVEGDTLHYFTAGNVHNQVSLSLVDKALTEQLNRERNVDVRLGR
jgi:hypothetical protein